jgi:mono/diheme cytochrome c family protein
MRRSSLPVLLAAGVLCVATAGVARYQTAWAANAPTAMPAKSDTALTAAGAITRAPQPPNKYAEVCAACHQATGAGVEGAFPPLDGSEWVTGRPDLPIAIVLHGLQGEITVKGKKYNSAMMPWASALTDADIAAVLTYTRSSWSNRAAPVTAAQVRAVRRRYATRTTQWTAAELRAIR